MHEDNGTCYLRRSQMERKNIFETEQNLQQQYHCQCEQNAGFWSDIQGMHNHASKGGT